MPNCYKCNILVDKTSSSTFDIKNFPMYTLISLVHAYYFGLKIPMITLIPSYTLIRYSRVIYLQDSSLHIKILVENSNIIVCNINNSSAIRILGLAWKTLKKSSSLEFTISLGSFLTCLENVTTNLCNLPIIKLSF